ncbi:apolipoprotein D and lipocalin family protein [Arachidicoccus rhizosphaerae]|uniref:Apolipoprotein D and lipocalin family protein n=1 Tax=Arachidicoccus rhizosphaerae TaxID=551991 RepID=A0A1H4AKT1_9BACT|nr:lipocalin family protein [Arachidicoccus rhizosphaerae]SEA36274.1 apolipoprotein D and lipocalin family protein [Arachidicoccus rhizosphaerae]
MKKKLILGTTIAMGAVMLLRSMKTKPRKAEPIKDFDLYNYLGNWYEIARLDHRFEKHMTNVMASYSVNEDGNIRIINSGYQAKKDKWEKVEAVGKFRGSEHEGALKVSFFTPIYEGYNIISIDDNYKYALIAGRNLEYLWILSREKSIPQNIKNNYLKLAELIGYNISKLTWVRHDKQSPFEQKDILFDKDF